MASALLRAELSVRPPRSPVTALRCPEHVPSPSRTLRKAAEKSSFSRSMPVERTAAPYRGRDAATILSMVKEGVSWFSTRPRSSVNLRLH